MSSFSNVCIKMNPFNTIASVLLTLGKRLNCWLFWLIVCHTFKVNLILSGNLTKVIFKVDALLKKSSSIFRSCMLSYNNSFQPFCDLCLLALLSACKKLGNLLDPVRIVAHRETILTTVTLERIVLECRIFCTCGFIRY